MYWRIVLFTLNVAYLLYVAHGAMSILSYMKVDAVIVFIYHFILALYKLWMNIILLLSHYVQNIY